MRERFFQLVKNVASKQFNQPSMTCSKCFFQVEKYLIEWSSDAIGNVTFFSMNTFPAIRNLKEK